MSLVAFLGFFLWLFLMSFSFYFFFHVAPSALRRWADEQGYRILRRRTAGPVKRMRVGVSNGHQVYDVTVVDKTGQERRGLVRLGYPFWFCLSVDRCPVAARWNDGGSAPPSAPSKRSPMWDSELD
jgi:hypothetical protein